MDNNNLRVLRHKRVRKNLKGVSGAPRLCVFRSAKHIYAQIIDDSISKTLAAASDRNIKGEKLTKLQKAAEVGKLIADRAKAKKIEKVVFDRGGHAFAGRVSALAQGAREGGLKF